MERKTNSNITRVKSGKITKTEIVSTTSYEKGLSWGSFKIIFLVCLLTIFSCIFFVGDMPTGFKNSIRQDTIKTIVGYEEIPPEKDIIYDSLTLDNITDYTFSFKKTFQFPVEFYNNFSPLNDNDILGLGNVIDKDKINMFDINSDVVYNNSSYPDIYYYGMYRYPYVSSYIPINYSIYNSAGHIGFNTWHKNGRYGYKGESFNYLLETKPFSYDFGSTSHTTFSYFDIKFTENYVYYYKIAYGNDLTKFNNMLAFLYYSTDFVNLPTTTRPIYVEYPVSYSTYNWTGIKIQQLSYFKNIFEPLFNQENQDITNNISLNNGFDYLETLIAKGLISYIGDKITPNRSWGENWSLADDNLTINQKYKFAKFMGSNVGYFINSNYYYDDDIKTFVRYNTNQLYGSLENDNNTTWQNLLNVLSYPLTTSYNILYNIGVFFTFIFYW